MKRNIKIYDKTIEYYLAKFNTQKYKVVGLFIGGRRTIPKSVQAFWKKQNVYKWSLYEICITTVKSYIQI